MTLAAQPVVSVASGATSSEARRVTRRLNLGCGPVTPAGWINVDCLHAPGVDLRSEVRVGLAVRSESLDYIVGMHVLQNLPYTEVEPALRELHRVLMPGGVLRLGVPDLDRAIAAYVLRDRTFFHVPDAHAASVGAKLVTQILWYGSVRTPFTFDFAAEMLGRAGFRDVVRCAFGETESAFEEIVALDNRERETLFVEAVR
jgi:SAM-dependent methyltransferase